MQYSYTLEDISNITLNIHMPSVIFLHWDLGAGKTTIAWEIIRRYFPELENIPSPTYTYYNIYKNDAYIFHHFDLYRLENYEEFVSIWWEEIIDNNTGIILIEWPSLLERHVESDISIFLEKVWENCRKIHIEYKKS